MKVMNLLEGYKSFNKDHINSYGKRFEEDKIYESKDGFYFSTNFEDTLRYFDGHNEDISVAKVLSLKSEKKIIKLEDEYYGYYDNYITNYLKIIKFLDRNDIYHIICKSINDIDKINRIIQGLKLTNEEIEWILKNVDKYYYNSIEKSINFYQKRLKR